MANKKTIFSTPWFGIESEEYPELNMTGKEAFYRIIAANGVLILPITPEGNIVCIRQYRPALNMMTWELPAGGIDVGEMPEQAAARELYEETGYECEQYERLCPLGLPIMANRANMEIFMVRGKGAIYNTAFKPREDEDIEVACVSLEEFKNNIAKGSFLQVAGLAALLLHQWNP